MENNPLYRKLLNEQSPAELDTPVDRTEADRLKETLLEFISEEAGMVKNLAAQSKKQLAREVVHLRGLVKTIKGATSLVAAAEKPRFTHAEAFMLMIYIEQEPADTSAARMIQVWNSRDGVTPFIINIGATRYQHHIPSMRGPFFDLPRADPLKVDIATHVWVTRTDREVMEAWCRTLDKAVELGRMEAAKAEALRENMEVAESWHYRMGLRDLATGRFTDEDVLAAAQPQEAQNEAS